MQMTVVTWGFWSIFQQDLNEKQNFSFVSSPQLALNKKIHGNSHIHGSSYHNISPSSSSSLIYHPPGCLFPLTTPPPSQNSPKAAALTITGPRTALTCAKIVTLHQRPKSVAFSLPDYQHDCSTRSVAKGRGWKSAKGRAGKVLDMIFFCVWL